MSSISAQGVVERASAELSKRINGLGLRSKHHHSHGKTSVMERVTNALCGGSSHNNASIGAPEKPSRVAASGKQIGSGKLSASNSHQNTPLFIRKMQPPAPNIGGAVGTGGGALIGYGGNNCGPLNTPNSHITTIEQLMLDERFLGKFFQYFSSFERRTLAQVCTTWRDVLYRNPWYWSGILPVLQCRELRHVANQDRIKLYNSLIRRGFHAVCLLGATDEDALDVVHSFPLASKHIHSLSLRCASVSDRGLEALLDHLQVSIIQIIALFQGSCKQLFAKSCSSPANGLPLYVEVDNATTRRTPEEPYKSTETVFTGLTHLYLYTIRIYRYYTYQFVRLLR